MRLLTMDFFYFHHPLQFNAPQPSCAYNSMRIVKRMLNLRASFTEEIEPSHVDILYARACGAHHSEYGGPMQPRVFPKGGMPSLRVLTEELESERGFGPASNDGLEWDSWSVA